MRDWSDAESHVEQMILKRLAGGASMRASDFWKCAGNVWSSLLRLEKKGLIWRAFDYEDWRTMHRWRVTGCGRLLKFTPNAETIAAMREADEGHGETFHGSIEEAFDKILNEGATQ